MPRGPQLLLCVQINSKLDPMDLKSSVAGAGLIMFISSCITWVLIRPRRGGGGAPAGASR
jgi:hypothetical protein